MEVATTRQFLLFTDFTAFESCTSLSMPTTTTKGIQNRIYGHWKGTQVSRKNHKKTKSNQKLRLRYRTLSWLAKAVRSMPCRPDVNSPPLVSGVSLTSKNPAFLCFMLKERNNSSAVPSVQDTGHHQCVNWARFEEWMGEHSFDPHKPGLLLHPQFGKLKTARPVSYSNIVA